MSRIAVFDLATHKEHQGHWCPLEVETDAFTNEVEYSLPDVVIALTDDNGDVKYAAVGQHPAVGRCKNADTWCWCSNHGTEEDHTLQILA